MDTPTTKRCTKCGQEFPATTEYFHRDAKIKSGLQSQCKQCKRTTARAYYQKEQEHIRERVREYQIKNAEKIGERKRLYYQQNSEEIRRKIDEHRRSNLKEANEQRLRWKRANSEKVREGHRRYKREHPEKVRQDNFKRRARKLGAEGSHTPQDIDVQYKRQKGLCYWCGVKLGINYHADHIVPLSRGGSNAPENIVITCPSCNLSKSDKLPHEWKGSGGRLL